MAAKQSITCLVWNLQIFVSKQSVERQWSNAIRYDTKFDNTI